MRRLVPLVLALAACTEPQSGPLKIGIVSGNNQISPAPTSQLGAPIVGKLVRLSNGSVAWRPLDAILPAKAYAQGQQTLQGSPVVGAVVCAKPIEGPVKLEPVVACTNTAADGTATFAFTHGTTAGEAKAIVQGMLNGQVATFDTAKAVVTAGPLAVFGWHTTRDTTVTAGSVLDFDTYPTRGRDLYGNIVPRDQYVISTRRANADESLSDPVRIDGTKVTMRMGDTAVYLFANGIGDSHISVRVKPQ